MAGVFLGFPLCQKHLGKSDTREGISAMTKHHLRQSQQRNGSHGRVGNHVAELLRETPCTKHMEGGEAENGEQTVKEALITPSSHKEEYRLTMKLMAPADVHILQCFLSCQFSQMS